MNVVKQGNATLESYAYNHRGERVLRKPAGGAAQITLYGEAGKWLGNYSATGEAQQQAIWLDNYPVALINVPSTGVPELAYVQPDHLGTPRVVIDPVRNVSIWEWSNKSEVFGNQIPSADPDGDGLSFLLALRFPGQQATDASGFFYNSQREYDPEVGRYSQGDPLGLNGGILLYLYASARPVASMDPFGLLDWELNPVAWKRGTRNGDMTATYPGAPTSEFRANTLARTTMEWTISPKCNCDAAGHYLEEYAVGLTPTVLMRDRYDSPAIRRSTMRDEMDHVGDLQGWAENARAAAERFEASIGANRYQSAQECEVQSAGAMQSHLSESILPAVIRSRQQWDDSGKHRLIIRGR